MEYTESWIEEEGKKKKNIQREKVGLTLGLSELALLNTSLDGLVELSIKSGLGSNIDLVVGRNIFLDGLTAKK